MTGYLGETDNNIMAPMENAKRIKAEANKKINVFEKNLNDFSIENAIKQLEDRGISLTKEEVEKASKALGIDNIKDDARGFEMMPDKEREPDEYDEER